MTKLAIQQKIAKAKLAANKLGLVSAKTRTAALKDIAKALNARQALIISANQKDISRARAAGRGESFIERLTLSEDRVAAMARAVFAIAKLPEVVGKILETKKRPSGITVNKVRVPLGLIAMIYESRPNVTLDAFALAFKSANAILLKGGNEIAHTNAVLVKIIKHSLQAHKIDSDTITDMSGLPQSAAAHLMNDRNIDCLIPRGGKGLIEFVREHARVPVIITGASVVHTYVADDADTSMAADIIVNAKTRRVSICNALDTIVVHRKKAAALWRVLAPRLAERNVTIKADTFSYEILKKLRYPFLQKAGAKDFDTEFLDYTLAVRTVDSLNEALAHIQQHSLGHSEAIITRSKKQAQTFFSAIDAACLYWNTSTQFSDGGEFGLHAEIGISTQKLHARGPFAYESLTTYKYLVSSKGATRKG